jgi:hypothetical protein
LLPNFRSNQKIEQAGGGRRLDAAHHHQIFEVVGAQAGSVDLMNAGMKSRAGPAHKFFEIGIDDGPETSRVAQSLSHAARKISQRIAIIRKGELQARLLQPRTKASRIGDLPPGVEERRLRLLRRGRFPVRAVARPGGRNSNERARGKCDDPPSCHVTVHGAQSAHGTASG